MAEVILKNNSRRPVQINLAHDVYCRRRQSCNCSITKTRSPRGKIVSRKDAKSVEILALAEVVCQREILHLPHVKACLKSKLLSRVEIEDKKAAAAAAAAAVVVVASASEGSKKGQKDKKEGSK